MLRVDSTTHHLRNETVPREKYTINENIVRLLLLMEPGECNFVFLTKPPRQVYEAHISRYDSERGWSPYSGLHDLQLEFTMLDPHVRTGLLPVDGQPGLYHTAFSVPDRHGVFKLVLDHRRRGWTTLKAVTVVTVVPPRHDGYPRFLSAAWPYYAGAISTSVGFLILSALWLAGDDARDGKKGKSTKTE